jgi:EmrB/QacA subfamily drug resistance transporter
MATFMATLDGSIVNIILPVVAENFKVTISQVQWVITAYLLCISALLLVWGKLSDIYGRKHFFAAGMVIFTAGSAACGFAPTFAFLVASRVVQALGASIMMALTQGIVTEVFPANERGKALGFIGMVVAMGSLAGPSLGGILVHLFSWQAVFFINVPFGMLGLALTYLVMPENRRLSESKEFDFKGTSMFVAVILLAFLSLLNLQEGSITSLAAGGMLAASALLMVVFLGWERKTASPLLDLSLFDSGVFSIGLSCAYLSFCAMFTYNFFMPFYLHYVAGMTVLQAGIMMSLYPVTMALVAPVSGMLSDRISFKPLTVAGLCMSTLSLFIMSGFGAGTSRVLIGIGIVLIGAGSSVFQSPNNSSIMGAVPKDKLGTAGSINAFFRNFGMVSGTTISVIIFSLVTNLGIDSITGSAGTVDLFLKGYRVVFLCAGAVDLAAVLLSVKRARSL